MTSRIVELPTDDKATMSVVDIEGFSHSSTIAAANLVERSLSPTSKSVYNTSSTSAAQVTHSGVFLFDLRLRTLQDSWRPDTANISIVAADVSPSQVCLALSSGVIVLLCINDGKLELRR